MSLKDPYWLIGGASMSKAHLFTVLSSICHCDTSNIHSLIRMLHLNLQHKIVHFSYVYWLILLCSVTIEFTCVGNVWIHLINQSVKHMMSLSMRFFAWAKVQTLPSFLTLLTSYYLRIDLLCEISDEWGAMVWMIFFICQWRLISCEWTRCACFFGKTCRHSITTVKFRVC